MLKKRRRAWASMVAVAALTMLLAACNGDDSPVTLPEGVTLPDISAPEVDPTNPPETAPPTTEAPTTEAPSTEEPATESGEVPVWVWALVLLMLVGLVAWLAARAGSRGSNTPPPPQTYPPPPPPQAPPPPPQAPPPPPTDQQPPPGA